MAEMDALERRVATALLGYVDEVPDAVDAAAVAHRVALEHPRGRARRVAWRPTALPWATWVLVLLAALLGALVGGVLVAGSQRERMAPALVPPAVVAPPVVAPPAVVPPPALACPPESNPDVPGPVDQARPSTFEISMAFDRAAGKVVALGANGTWTFDVCTNTWTRMHPKTVPYFDLFQMLVYDAGARQTIYVAEDGVWAYDLDSDTWTRRGDIPATDGPRVRLVYDPVGSRVVALEVGAPDRRGARRMWSYDAGTGAWQPIAQNEQLSAVVGEQPLLAYDQSVDRLVSYSLDGEVRLFDLRTGTWSAPVAESPPFTYGTPMMNTFSFGGEIAYDEVTRKTVLFSHGVVIAYDASEDRWETLYDRTFPGTPHDGRPTTSCGTNPECRQSSRMIYDPVNERLLVYGGRGAGAEGWGFADAVLAFDTRTREWTVLLEPSRTGRPE